MAERKVLANAIRFLSMDAVQKLIPVTRVPQWVWRISQRYYGATF